jgi:hypothetical protein
VVVVEARGRNIGLSYEITVALSEFGMAVLGPNYARSSDQRTCLNRAIARLYNLVEC